MYGPTSPRLHCDDESRTIFTAVELNPEPVIVIGSPVHAEAGAVRLEPTQAVVGVGVTGGLGLSDGVGGLGAVDTKTGAVVWGGAVDGEAGVMGDCVDCGVGVGEASLAEVAADGDAITNAVP